MNNTHKVFVYGTLMYGQPNHTLLNTAMYLGRATTKERYNFFSLGAFPAVLIDPVKNNWKVEGEIYQVDDSALARLDMLESNGTLYLRRMRPFNIIVDKHNANIHAWIYELCEKSFVTSKTPGNDKDFILYEDQVATWSPKEVIGWR